jgi:isoquinoline 1-oxidoreductase beta subunit
MGQGVINAIPQIIAEELDLDWSTIEVELAEANPKYGQLRTSGSTSIRKLWMPLRKGAAQARDVLVQAASQTWQINKDSLNTQNSQVINKATGQSLTYGELAALANTLDLPENPELKDESQFKLVGKSEKRINTRDIVTGQANYGIDTSLSNLHYAAIAHSPTLNGKLSAVEHPDSLVSGVKGIVELESAVAVVANSYWLARKTLDKLQIRWQQAPSPPLEQEQIEKDFTEVLSEPGELIQQEGEISDSGNYTISANYYSAYQAHACMEPINCTAHIHEDGCDIWAPTQHPMMALSEARKAYHSQIGKWSSKILRKLGISDNVNIHTTLIGGGFGRRLEQDFVTEVVTIAKHFDFPVKLIWSREEDIKNDFYRPYSAHKLEAQLEKGQITKWIHKATGASVGKVSGGAIDFPYSIANRSLYFHTLDHSVPIGSWRSVSDSNHAFATEGFIDEIANKLSIDPLTLRTTLLKEDRRSSQVLHKLREFCQWDLKDTNNRKLGIAFNRGFGSYIAIAIELNQQSTHAKIESIYCIADCGIIVNTSSAKAQLEGGILYGLNAATTHEISIDSHAIKQSNFDSYPLLRMNEIPYINIDFVKSYNEPGGIGEIAVPVVAPALANAIFNATGIRHNKVPIS